eukprot:3987278-Karenia_brevis.AAC.1
MPRENWKGDCSVKIAKHAKQRSRTIGSHGVCSYVSNAQAMKCGLLQQITYTDTSVDTSVTRSA